MIISFKHQFVFLHPRKCAGTSIKLALSPYLGDTDIVVGSISVMANHAKKYPKNLFWKAIHPMHGIHAIKPLAYSLIDNKKKYGSINRNIKHYYGQKINSTTPDHIDFVNFNKFFSKECKKFKTFTIIRNPYTHALSAHQFFVRSQAYSKETNPSDIDISFSDYLKKIESLPEGDVNKGYWNYIFDGNNKIDHIIQFETISDDFRKISRELVGQPLELDIHTRKTKYHEAHYSEYYTDSDVERIKKIYKKELDFFEYEFEDLR